eukprot:5932188-Pleurochrysis_carterae.AAC.2
MRFLRADLLSEKTEIAVSHAQQLVSSRRALVRTEGLRRPRTTRNHLRRRSACTPLAAARPRACYLGICVCVRACACASTLKLALVLQSRVTKCVMRCGC